MDELNLAKLDVDGAVQETAAALQGDTRSAFLRKAGLAGGALAGGGTLLGALAPGAPGAGASRWLGRGQSGRPSPAFGRGDIGILNFRACPGALAGGVPRPGDRCRQDHRPGNQGVLWRRLRVMRTLVARGVEAGAKGRDAIAMPTFDFQGITEDQGKFQQTAYVLENRRCARISGAADQHLHACLSGCCGVDRAG